MVILIIIIILAALLFGIFRLASFVVSGLERATIDEAMAWQAERYDVSFYDRLEKEDYTIPGQDGYLLRAELLKNPVYTKQYVILSHGYTDNRRGSLKYVPMYLQLGYNCVIYDLRGHGENAPHITTYGILEAQDLKNVIRDTRTRYPDLTQLGLHGESLGAASSVTALKYRPEVDFVVSDCAFADLEKILKEGIRGRHMPAFLVDMAAAGIRLRYHYSMKDMRPVDALDENRIPVLFLHGAADDLILPHNARDLYDRTKGKKELHLIEGDRHAVSILTAPQEYAAYVTGFLRSIRGKDEAGS